MERFGLAIAATGTVLGLVLTPLKAQNTSGVAAGKKSNLPR